jgi:hypothetical protein
LKKLATLDISFNSKTLNLKELFNKEILNKFLRLEKIWILGFDNFKLRFITKSFFEKLKNL